MDRNFGFIGAIGGFVSLITEIISLATSEWIIISGFKTDGLWQSCYVKYGCTSYVSVPEYVQVVRVIMIISCLLLAAGFFLSIIMAMGKDADAIPKIIIALFLLSAISILVAMGIFTAKVKVNAGTSSYGYSYYLGWLTCGMSLFLCCALGNAK